MKHSTFITTPYSVKGFKELAKLAKALPSRPDDPRDVSINHDYYAWGGKKLDPKLGGK